MDGREKNSGLELCVSSLVATTGASREIKTSYRHAALSSRDVMFTCRVTLRVIQSKQKKSREKFLSKNELHFRDQRIDISHRFNFEYYIFNINKVRKNQ